MAKKHTRFRKALTALILIVIVFIVWLGIGGFPIVLQHSNTNVFPIVNEDENVVNPLKDIDLSNGKAVLYLSSDDWNDLPDGMSTRRMLVCTDTAVLRQLKDFFSFEISGGDMATVESELWVYSYDTLLLKTGIDINQNCVGIQNEHIGWAKAVDKERLCHVFAQFKPYRLPFVKL